MSKPQHKPPIAAQRGNPVPSVDEHESAVHAARLMAESGTDSLVVLSRGRPVGLVTDHDLALRIAGADADPVTTTVGAAMSQPLISINGDATFAEVVTKMRKHVVRRMPILEAGKLVGMVELDDLLITLAGEFGDLAECLRRELHVDAGLDSTGNFRYQEKRGRIGWRPHLRWQI